MKAVLVVLAAVAISACGGGETQKLVVSFYGDSITAGRPMDIAKGDFDVQDFAAPAKNSDSPLDPSDTSSITVLRYGMADILHGIPPEATRWNVMLRMSQIAALGRRPVVVNVNATESGLERPTNAALAGIVTIDVSDIKGATVDGVHPSEEFHVALNQRIHDGVLAVARLR